MCFGSTWSTTSFAILAMTSLAGVYRAIPSRIVLGTAFLALKELIQMLLYRHLESCNETNKYLTAAAWIHISFQPLFMNLFISAFSATPHLYDVPIMLCLMFAIANTFRLKEVRGAEATMCTQDTRRNPCRPLTCSTNGKYHLAYGFALYSSDISGYTPSMFSFFLLMFAPAFVIGDWQLASINAVVATLSYTLVAHDTGESSAIWCVNSFWVAFFALYYIVYRQNPFLKK